MKTCSKCKVDKGLTEFYKDRSRKDGLSNKCKVCVLIITKEYHWNNRAKVLARKRRYHHIPENKKRSNLQNLERHERLKNEEWYKAQRAEWGRNHRQNNKAAKNADTRRYQSNKKGLTPDMNKAELAEIEGMYQYHQIFHAVMPEKKWHVDHIQPLAAGGLHHPSNLQVLTEHDNCSKGYKWD